MEMKSLKTEVFVWSKR